MFKKQTIIYKLNTITKTRHRKSMGDLFVSCLCMFLKCSLN